MSNGNDSAASWKRCGVCKRELGFEADYFACSVSTCTSGRNHPAFCSVACWEQHVPVMRHRDAWAEQKRSPGRAEWEGEQAAAPAPTRRVVADARSAARPEPAPLEVLVVASRLKAWIRSRAGMNTSESVLEELSQIIRDRCEEAIGRARADGRKTVMDRDFRG